MVTSLNLRARLLEGGSIYTVQYNTVSILARRDSVCTREWSLRWVAAGEETVVGAVAQVSAAHGRVETDSQQTKKKKTYVGRLIRLVTARARVKKTAGSCRHVTFRDGASGCPARFIAWI